MREGPALTDVLMMVLSNREDEAVVSAAQLLEKQHDALISALLFTKAMPAESGVWWGTVITRRMFTSPDVSLAARMAYFMSLSGFSGVYGIRTR